VASRYDAEQVFELLGYLGAVIGAGFAVLQTRKTLRAGTVEGVSKLSWVAMTLSAALWLNYGVQIRSLPQVFANLPWFPMVWVLGWGFSREEVIRRSTAILAPMLALTLTWVMLAAEPNAITWLGLLFGQLIGIPQLLATYRSTDPEGVSGAAWAAGAVGSLCWVLHGIGTGKPPVAITAAVSLLVGAANAVLLRHKIRKAPSSLQPTG
jgi:uncharacterized protein with PQ loop repeat